MVSKENNYIDLTKSKKTNNKSKNNEEVKNEIKKNPKIVKDIKKTDKPIEEKSYDKIRVIIIIMLIIGLILFLSGLLLLFLRIGYYVYLNLPGDIESPNATIDTLPVLKNYSIDGVRQFYPNMKFNHNDISYKFEDECDDSEKIRVNSAFDMITTSIPTMIFHETSSDNPDIDVTCSENNLVTPNEGTDFFIAGEGGAKEVIQTGRYNVISNGAIYIYTNQRTSTCNWPNVELHELIHVFGFNHSRSSNSLMYPILQNCNQKLDSGIVKELTRLYGEKNLPDLYFEDVQAVKKGRYLDFNVTIKNSGDVDANNVSFTVLESDKVIETKNLKDLKYGAGIVMEVKNFKLESRDSTKIDIIIDYFNKTNELDKNNNIAKIRF